MIYLDKTHNTMAIWAPGTKEFVMSIIPDRRARSCRVNVPPPVREKLGNPTHIRFVIRGNRVVVEAAGK